MSIKKKVLIHCLKAWLNFNDEGKLLGLIMKVKGQG